jgi:hypothetical protein
LYIIRNHVTTKFDITCTGKSLPVCIFIIPFETSTIKIKNHVSHGGIKIVQNLFDKGTRLETGPVILAGGRISKIIKKKKNCVKKCYMIPSKHTGKIIVIH